MATTDLKLDEPGTLPKPGPVGRVARLVFGLLCGVYVLQLTGIAGDFVSPNGFIRSEVLNGIIPGLFLVSYVVNIGFSVAWGKRPAIGSAIVLSAVGVFGYYTTGSWSTPLLAQALWGWEVYVFSHLGLSFFIAAVIGTPGCEMRALHDLYSRITGIPTKEHYCPVGPLHPIDRWELGRNNGQSS